MVRKDEKDRIYKNEEAKFNAVALEVKRLHEHGQPVLIGTTSIDKSEKLSGILDRIGVKHEVLNAKYHEREAQIVAIAGQKGAVTVATNMAGRGTDIPITDEVKELGGLAVIGTERHEARRIDNQLRGRSGRQGDPGYSRFYVAMDDMIMKMLGGEILEKLMNVIRVPDDQPIEMGMISKRINDAQRKVEWANFDTRKHLVEYDDVMNHQREIFYTRRRKFLTLAEESLGRFLEETTVVDTRGNKELDGKYKDRLDESKQLLVNEFKDVVLEEVDYLIKQQLDVSTELDTENSKNLAIKYFDMIIDVDAIDIFDETDPKKLVNKVASELEGKSLGESTKYLVQPMNRVIDKKLKELGDNIYELYKMMTLESMNTKWVDHLEHMQDIREGVRLQGFAQRDPLVEYKSLGFVAFDQFLAEVNSNVAKRILKMKQVSGPTIQTQQLPTNTDEIDDVSTGDREFTKALENKGGKVNDVIGQIRKQEQREKAVMQKAGGKQLAVGSGQSSSKKYGRNDKVTVKYGDGTVKKGVKYKKVENDINSGQAVIV